jgi:glycosidase
MPDFNLKNPAVVAYHQDNLRLWLNRGADGFRFDAIGELVENGPAAWYDQPESYALMAEVRALVGGYANRYMVCEDPDGTSRPDQVQATDACGAAFDFGLRPRLVAAAGGDAAALSAVAGWFEGRAPEVALRRATLLANHDGFTGGRVLDQLGGSEARARVAAALLLLLPGTPFIYYGEELGMTGATSLSGDWKIRTPMSWSAGAGAGFTTGTPFRALSGNAATHHVAAEEADPHSLLAWYRQLIALRRAVPALAAGSYEAPQVQGSVLAFRRSSGASHALVLVNVGAATGRATVSGLPAGATLAGRFPVGTGDAVAAGDGTLAVAVPALAPLVYTW